MTTPLPSENLHRSTSIIIEDALYIRTPNSFFEAFDGAWNSVREQILKLETRQVYKEPGNPSYEAFISGNFELAVSLIPDSKKDDIAAFKELAERNVDFIRCRPISLPLSDYLKWEIENYAFNEKFGEKIYFTDNLEIFEKYAHHDFMVFDRSVAFVHDYDAVGEIQGGWKIEDQERIDALISLHTAIKSKSVYWKDFPLH